MKRTPFLPFLFAPLFPLLLLSAMPAPVRAGLDADIKAVLQDPYLKKAEVGIQIVRLGAKAEECAVVYRHNSDIPLTPASNLKLLTTAAAIERLGADFKFRTLLVRHGNDIYIVGDGDPSFGDSQLLKKVNWEITTVFAAWADLLKKQNITSVGRVMVDDSVFDRTWRHPNWAEYERDFPQAYVAPVGGFNLNCSCVDIFVQAGSGKSLISLVPPTRYLSISNTSTVGAANSISATRRTGANELLVSGTVRDKAEVGQVTVEDPSEYAATVFAEVLVAAGIKVESAGVDGAARTAIADKDSAAAWTVLAIHETPLIQVINRANKDSKNVYAEALCKRLGFAATGQTGTWASGTGAVGEYLKSTGMPAEQFLLDDGSGLSKKNLASTNVFLAALKQQYYARTRDAYMESLAIAGMDGTLKTRFKNTKLAKRVFGKSGYVSGVGALSGYVRCNDEQVYAFSILMNGLAPATNTKAHEMQEKILKALDASVTVGR